MDSLTKTPAFSIRAVAEGTTYVTSAPMVLQRAAGIPITRAMPRSIPAHTVNLGFVINVIEDIDERVAALRGAYALISHCHPNALLGRYTGLLNGAAKLNAIRCDNGPEYISAVMLA